MYSLTDAIELVEDISDKTHLPINPYLVAKELYFSKKVLFFKVQENLNINVDFISDESFICKTFKHKGTKDCYTCIINSSHPSTVVRFATAHCIGHILLGHLEKNEVEIDKSFSFDAEKRDKDANLVASHLLAPKVLIDGAINLRYTDINKIANLLEVSTMLISRRLKEEGYL